MIRRFSKAATASLRLKSSTGISSIVALNAQRPAIFNTFRQILHLDYRAGRQNNQTFHDIFEFPDIARPVVTEQEFPSIRGYPGNPLLFQPIETTDEIFRQWQNVSRTFPERRCRNGNDIEPIIEIFTETALFDGGLQVLIGGGDDPEIRGNSPGAANTLKLLQALSAFPARP